MILYAESSAVVAWLLGESARERVMETIRSADFVISAGITPLECRRSILSAELAGRVGPQQAATARATLEKAAATWALRDVDAEVLRTASEPFPAEPVRTLDAIHLATARLCHARLGGIVLLTLDERIRRNAEALGIPHAP